MEIAAGYVKENAEAVAEKIIQIVEELIAAYNGVAGDADNLLEKMKNVKYLAKDIRSCKGMPGDAQLTKLHAKLEESKNAVLHFQEKEDKIKNSKSVVKISTFKVKRFFIYAPDFTAKFKDLNDTLDALPEELKRIKELAEVLLKPNSLAYRDKFVNPESRKFWLDISGTELGNGEESWSKFQTLYKNENPNSIEWSDEDWECIRRVACTFGHDLTLFGFIILTNKAGYPIDINKVPSILDSRSTMNEVSRIEIGKMINDLIKEFSSEEMNNHIVSVYKWYGSFNQDQLKDIVMPEKKENETDKEKESRKSEERRRIKYYKAEECYRIIQRIRDEKKHYDQCTDTEKLALDVEKARRVVSFFYQQFMVICEFGRLSRDIFKNVDFPGKARIRAFIGDYKPLDFANYRIIIKRGEFVEHSVWCDKQPKVYNFLEEFLKESKTIEEKKKASMEKRLKDLDTMEENLIKMQTKLKREKEEFEREKEELRLRIEELEKNEDTYAKKAADLKTKEIISKFQSGIFLSKKKEDKQPKSTKDKFKEGAQKLTDASKRKNKVESSTSQKKHDD